MKINDSLIKKMRIDRNWSQEQLSELSGLSLRTIQRIESGSNASMASINILATTFQVEPNDLMQNENQGKGRVFDAIKTGFVEFSNFSGKTTRTEYWWFFLFVILVMGIATTIHEKVGVIVDLVLLVPLLAAGNRRLNDAGQSVWWQFFWLAPFGQIVVLILMAQPSRDLSVSDREWVK